MSEPLASPLEGNLLLMLFMTRRCNLDCSYCHMDHNSHPDQTLERLYRMVDLAFASYTEVLLHLFGGEPLMRPDLLDSLLTYVAKHYGDRDHKKLITTNGILLGGRNLEMLLEHEVNLMLSLDGTFDSQGDMRVANANNKGAYKAIIRNLKTLLDREIPFFVNMCVSPENVDRMFDNAAFFKGLGIPRLQIAYELGALWTPQTQARYIAQFERCITQLQGPHFRLQNNRESEPVLGSSLAILDADGEIYRGCAIVLEKNNPTFNTAAYVCHLDDLDDLRGFVKPRIDVVRYFMKHTTDPGDWSRIRSCMHLGYRLKHQMSKLDHVS